VSQCESTFGCVVVLDLFIFESLGVVVTYIINGKFWLASLMILGLELVESH
jgi:hypothetical protein